uniref:C2H2-type domain-containing protein n=1 Tax=Anopheles coluzzii TaxID=1518534 RepID=A0A6E8WBL8_ANOCL
MSHQDEGGTFECKACSKTFTHSNALKDHFNSRQDALKLRICFKCLGSVKSSTDFRHACIRNDSTFRELSSHPKRSQKKKSTKHRTRPTTSSWRKHYKRPLTLCEICGKVVADYKAHILTHKEAGYSCPFCPAKVAHPANFARHVQQVHEKDRKRSQHGIGKLHECSMCSSKFKHPSGLNMHIRNVHRSDMHTCETCGKIFKVREALRRHYRTHSSEQPYGCRQCTKRFRSSYARTIHELTHAGVVFRCTHCDKSYRYKSQLMLHLRKSHPESQTATERASSEEVDQNPEIEVPIKDEFPTRKNVPSKKKKSK